MSSAVKEGALAGSRTSWFAKFAGGEMPVSPGPKARAVALAWLGGTLAIAAVGLLSQIAATPLVLGSFGATCVLVFAYPDVPFSQPRSVILGHFICSLTGLVFLAAFGPHWWAAGLAAGTAIAAMMVTRTVHPPAGSNPVIVFLAQPGWAFLLYPTLAGALIVTAIALVYNNATRTSNYPKYW